MNSSYDKEVDQSQNHINMKIITLGSSGVGKTSLILRITRDAFTEGQRATLGIEYFCKKLSVGNEPVNLQLWDTAGQERFRNVIPSAYVRKANGVLFAFDITREDSFQEIVDIFDQTMKQMSETKQNVSCLLIGCKSDLDFKRVVSFDVAQAFAESNGMHYIETSSKNNTNCFEVADLIAQLCYPQIKNNQVEAPQIIYQSQIVPINKQKKGCC